MAQSNIAKKVTNWRKIVPVEVYPIVLLTGVALGGATWYLTRLARGSDVIWDRKNNPTPWNSVAPGTQTKLMNINGEFDKYYKRDRL
ncbi:hypothetical protein MPSI1_001882 [Malassezia psittaci]|uniref:Uncharacterized protein n=1 Tax=Malassezia psittaci TaxID=1821823 RepID=A0AAF0F6D3_9BASI|nr:hypothetical protein MPSI1_001882 [Malassezia psittaci]